MSDKRPLPWPGIALALASGVLMAILGLDWIALLAIVGMWIGTLWLAQPEPPPARTLADKLELSLDTMRELIESSGMPLLLLDRNRIVVANSEARRTLGRHIVGQDARVALRHPDAVALLDRNEPDRTTIQGLTGSRSIWQVSRNRVNDRYWMVELINRTAEADISRAHTDFVANASHELRTPVASIIGYVETLLDQGQTIDKPMAERFLGTVLKEARRLQTLVDDLMSLSRIEAEKHDQPNERLELNALVAQAARDAGRPEDRSRIVIETAAQPLQIRGDRQQIEQLFRNLADNALKYGDQAEKVTISLSAIGNEFAEVRVIDRGEGIAPEHLPHLTRRFYRTDPGRSRASGGTGLGLAIVKHIVERHRGRLDIASRLGQGTTVTIRFPLVRDNTEPL